MANARIELVEGVSYTLATGEKFWKGSPQVIADQALIELLRGNSRFLVTDLEVATSEDVDDEPTGDSTVSEPTPIKKLKKAKKKRGRQAKKAPKTGEVDDG